MALVQRAHRLVWRFRDNDGAESTCQTYVANSVSPTAALQVATALAPLLQALSDARMITYNVIIEFVETSRPFISATSNINREGIFIFRTANTPAERFVMRVPSIRRDLLLDDGPYAQIAIDPEAAAVSAFVNAMINGVAGVAPVAPWQAGTFGGSSGTYGGGVSSGLFGGGESSGSWGDGFGGSGPWGAGGSSSGSFAPEDWLNDFRYTTGPRLVELRAAYQGRGNERLRIPLIRI